MRSNREPKLEQIVSEMDMKDMKLEVWVVLDATSSWAEVFSSKERAEAVYGRSSNVRIYNTVVDEEFNMLDSGD